MYLKKTQHKSGDFYLSIVEGYRDDQGKSKQRTIQSIGYLSQLSLQYQDPIAHFTMVAKQMTAKKQKDTAPVVLKFDPYQKLDAQKSLETGPNRKNLGALALSTVYHQLELDYFINNRRRYTKASFNHNAILRLLTYERVLFPGSKRSNWLSRGRYFEKMDFSLDDVYRSLPFFNSHRDALLSHLNTKITEQYGRDNSMLFYDVTNYYFEIDEEDDLRKKGFSKEHRPEPIIQMGLFMDEQGIPVTYDLFPGNTTDCKTLRPVMKTTTEQFGMKDMIIIADMGMMTGDNKGQIILDHNGYIISYSIRKSTDEFKQWVLGQDDYQFSEDAHTGKVLKFKERLIPKTIAFSPYTETGASHAKRRITVNERQIVFYSEKYARKARAAREKTILKARELITDSTKRGKLYSQGARKYISEVCFDEQGEVKEDFLSELLFDEEKLAEEERFDGYYAITTNVYGTSKDQRSFKGRSRWEDGNFLVLNREVTARDIIGMYRGLWEIEETFKITKSVLQSRPVYVSKYEHIQAHFLTCFLALTITRLLDHQLSGKYYPGQIAESLRKASGSYVENGYYVFDYYDQILADLDKQLGTDFSRKYLKLGEIRSMIGKTKKGC